MVRARNRLLTLLALFLVTACAAAGGRSVRLYPGPPMALGKASAIEIVRSHPRYGQPTLNVMKITRLGENQEILFDANSGRSWGIPTHFGGIEDPQQQAHQGDPSDKPDRFEILPGRYRVTYFYVPVTDRMGWTHRPSGESTVVLDCRAGYRYLLKGGLNQAQDGWQLSQVEERIRAGGGD